MSKRVSEPDRLRREEWDFSNVPDREIDACFSWGSCREWPQFLSDFAAAPINASDEAISSTWIVEQATNVRGALDIYQMGTEKFSGDFLSPWQTFSAEARAKAVPPQYAGFSEVHPILYQAMVSQGAKGKLVPLPGCYRHAIFSIDWNESDHRLLSDFAFWLRVNREMEARESRGSNPRDWLKMIGAMRLLHHYRFEEAFSRSTSASGQPLYGKRPSWERARKGALEAFRNYFFLDWTVFPNPPVPKSFPKYSKVKYMLGET